MRWRGEASRSPWTRSMNTLNRAGYAAAANATDPVGNEAVKPLFYGASLDREHVVNSASPHFGPRIFDEGVHFALWAPHQSCGISSDRRLRDIENAAKAMIAGTNLCSPLLGPVRATASNRDGRRVPDPASRFQPDDVHGQARSSIRWGTSGPQKAGVAARGGGGDLRTAYWLFHP